MFKVFSLVLFIGLLFCAIMFSQVTKESEATLGTAKTNFGIKNFSLAKTPAEIMASATEEVKKEEVAKIQDSDKTETETVENEEKGTNESEKQKNVFDIEIIGVRFSLSVQPFGYGYGYYGWGWNWGWNRPWYWGYYGPYDWRWNAWEWNYSGWYQPRRDRNRNTNPIHASQLRDPRKTTTARSAKQTIIAQSNITNQAKPARSISTQNPVKSYPSNNTVSRAQQKFNGRIAGKFTQSKQNPLFQKATPSIRSTANSRSILSRTQNTRSSTPRISNQPRPASSRTAFRPTSRTGSSRISAPARSSIPRSSAVHSSSARSSAPARSSSRPASSRGTAVRRK